MKILKCLIVILLTLSQLVECIDIKIIISTWELYYWLNVTKIVQILFSSFLKKLQV